MRMMPRYCYCIRASLIMLSGFGASWVSSEAYRYPSNNDSSDQASKHGRPKTHVLQSFAQTQTCDDCVQHQQEVKDF